MQIFSACASGERSSEDGEVLAEHENQPSADLAVAGDHAVAGNGLVGHPEIGAAVLHEHVPLFEAAFVEQQLDALPGGELALPVLGVDAALTPAEAGRVALLVQHADYIEHSG